MKLGSKDIAITALFVAIIAIMTFIPGLGMIPLLFLSINIVLVPILVACQITRPLVGCIVATFFGIFSCLRAYIMPAQAGILYFAVQNPLVSILPRIIVGLVACYSYRGLKKIVNKRKEYNNNNFKNRIKANLIPSIVSSFLGVTSNTFLFLGSLVLIYNGSQLSTGTAIGLPWAMGIVASNYLPEVIVACILVPIIVSALEKAVQR